MRHSALDLLFGNQAVDGDPRPNVKPPNTLDQFLNSQGGSLLVNLLAQQGFSRTPQSRFGALGKGLLQTQQQGQERSRSALEDQLLRSRIGLNRAKAAGGGDLTSGNVQSQFITKDNKLGFLRRNGEVVVTDQSLSLPNKTRSGTGCTTTTHTTVA